MDLRLNFRSTLAHAADGAGETAYFGAAYAAPPGFGWTGGQDGVRDRTTSTTDARLRGHHQAFNDGTTHDLRIDVPAPGTYEVRAAFGDAQFNMGALRAEFRDGAASLLVVTYGATGTGNFVDATGVERTPAGWISSNEPVRLTLTGTVLTLRLGTLAAAADSSKVAHLHVVQVDTPRTGDGAAGLPPGSAAGIGVVTVQGAGDTSLLLVQAAGSMDTPPASGDGAAALPQLAAVGSAATGIEGTGTAALGPPTCLGSAAVGLAAAGSASLPAAGGGGAAGLSVGGEGIAVVPGLQPVGAGALQIQGAGGGAMPSPAAAGTAGTATSGGSGAATLPAMVSAGVGALPSAGAGATSLPNLEGTAEGAAPMHGSGAAALIQLQPAAFGAARLQGDGHATPPPVAAAAGGRVALGGMGEAALPALAAAGAGAADAAAPPVLIAQLFVSPILTARFGATPPLTAALAVARPP